MVPNANFLGYNGNVFVKVDRAQCLLDVNVTTFYPRPRSGKQIQQQRYQPSCRSVNHTFLRVKLKKSSYLGSRNLLHTMICTHPDLGLILEPKGQRSRSHGSKVCEYQTTYNVTALYLRSLDGSIIKGVPASYGAPTDRCADLR